MHHLVSAILIISPYIHTTQSESGKHLYMWPNIISKAHPKSTLQSLQPLCKHLRTAYILHIWTLPE